MFTNLLYIYTFYLPKCKIHISSYRDLELHWRNSLNNVLVTRKPIDYSA